MEDGMIGIRVKVQGHDGPDMIESFGKLWDGVQAEQIRGWVTTMREHTPGKELSEVIFEALFLGMAQMANNLETIRKQESLRAAQIHERDQRPEGFDDYKRARPVVKMIRTSDEETAGIEETVTGLDRIIGGTLFDQYTQTDPDRRLEAAKANEELFVSVKAGLDGLREQLDRDESDLKGKVAELKQRIEGADSDNSEA